MKTKYLIIITLLLFANEIVNAQKSIKVKATNKAEVTKNLGFGTTVTVVWPDWEIEAIDYTPGYLKVSNGFNSGYLSIKAVYPSAQLDSFINACVIRNNELEAQEQYLKDEFEKLEAKKNAEKKAKADAAARQNKAKADAAARQKMIIEKYGQTIGTKILNKQYWLGMTPEMAVESIGRPNKINKSVGSWGVHEQWVYGGKYLYFENGILKSYQE